MSAPPHPIIELPTHTQHVHMSLYFCILAHAVKQESRASLEHRHRHRHGSAAYRAVALREPLAARAAHALVAAWDEDVRLGPIQTHDARVAVGIVLRISRRPLLDDLVY